MHSPFCRLVMYDNLSSQAIVVKYCLPRSLPHVLPLIDEYLSPIVHHKIFTAACERGESVKVLERIHRWVCPIWQDAVHGAVRGGHLHVFRWMIELKGGRGPWNADFARVFEVAAIHGQLNIIKWLYTRLYIGTDRRFGLSEDAFVLAAEHGHLDVVQCIFLHRGSCAKYDNSIEKAVANGHLAIVQWLCKFGAKRCSTHAANEAAKNGHLEVLQWLQSNGILFCTTKAMDGAAKNGHLEVLKWLHETHIKGCSKLAMRGAASSGHLEVVKWLYDNVNMNFDMSDSAWMYGAAKAGHLSLLQWMHDHFPRAFKSFAVTGAAEGGHLEVLMWLHKHRIERFTRKAPYWAACNGHKRVLQWLHLNYPKLFTRKLLGDHFVRLGDAAARNGHLEVVRWLHENNCRGFTTMAMDSAAKNGHLDVVLYLLEHRSEGFSHDTLTRLGDVEVLYPQANMLQSTFKARPSFVQGCLRCLAAIALRTSNIKILDWVKEFGLELRSTAPIRTAVYEGHVTLLQWFCRNGFDISEADLLELAVENGHLDTARWLSRHGYAINSVELVRTAEAYSRIRLLRWLVEYGPPLEFQMAKKLAMEYGCVEILWWVSESDRVQVVLEALQKHDLILLMWVLRHTSFQEKSSHQIIRDKIQRAPNKTLRWLHEELANFEECSWCLSKCTTANVESLGEKFNNSLHL